MSSEEHATNRQQGADRPDKHGTRAADTAWYAPLPRMLLGLQQTAGNAAVARAMQRGPIPPTVQRDVDRPEGNLPQGRAWYEVLLGTNRTDSKVWFARHGGQSAVYEIDSSGEVGDLVGMAIASPHGDRQHVERGDVILPVKMSRSWAARVFPELGIDGRVTATDAVAAYLDSAEEFDVAYQVESISVGERGSGSITLHSVLKLSPDGNYVRASSSQTLNKYGLSEKVQTAIMTDATQLLLRGTAFVAEVGVAVAAGGVLEGAAASLAGGLAGEAGEAAVARIAAFAARESVKILSEIVKEYLKQLVSAARSAEREHRDLDDTDFLDAAPVAVAAGLREWLEHRFHVDVLADVVGNSTMLPTLRQRAAQYLADGLAAQMPAALASWAASGAGRSLVAQATSTRRDDRAFSAWVDQQAQQVSDGWPLGWSLAGRVLKDALTGSAEHGAGFSAPPRR